MSLEQRPEAKALSVGDDCEPQGTMAMPGDDLVVTVGSPLLIRSEWRLLMLLKVLQCRGASPPGCCPAKSGHGVCLEQLLPMSTWCGQCLPAFPVLAHGQDQNQNQSQPKPLESKASWVTFSWWHFKTVRLGIGYSCGFPGNEASGCLLQPLPLNLPRGFYVT